MRSTTSCLLSAALVFAGGTADALPFTGTLLLQLSSFPVVSVPGSGSGDPTLPGISADAFVGRASAPVTGDPPFTQIFLSVRGNASGTLGTGPTFSGTFAARGFDGLGVVPLSLGRVTPAPPRQRLGFPGVFTRDHGAASESLQATFGAWTTGVATISRSHTAFTGACTPGGATCPTGMLGGATANVRYFGGAAQVVLVTPIDVFSSLASGLPTFTVLALNYVPEPAELTLLGSGALTMLLLGWRRPRR